ncbi:MAG: hypothetical protein ABIR62_13030 [Dokdonella sp.]|uniref:hypothetical protein n=1 Tax=Dokdonella sp. TaxID=2291710 RepID=UPI003265BC10
MSLTPFLLGLYGFACICLLLAIAQGRQSRLHWRTRRRFAAGHRALWALVFVLLALLGAFSGTALLGYRRLTSEALVATLDAHSIGPQRYTVGIEFPDGTRREIDLAGDDWQLDARVVKWTPSAVVMGAEPLYRLDRINGRYHAIEQERAMPKSAVALSEHVLPDLWSLKRRFPQTLGFVDADYGSAAYLPMVDGGRYTVTLAAAGGLVARAADAATAEKLQLAERAE